MAAVNNSLIEMLAPLGRKNLWVPPRSRPTGIPAQSLATNPGTTFHTGEVQGVSKELMQILSYPSRKGVLHTSETMGETIYRYSVMSINALYKLFPFY